eukprot:TRINITY_DN7998_c0_g3_i1.p1 TRINITY_DN7998_c0_g3~~TRINITY_DN7998_c0_g3_i1.p1  ORF type:complete len:142 (-),score=17.96 TRINITY_DN7998_c0_g3_i1:58-483(-)
MNIGPQPPPGLYFQTAFHGYQVRFSPFEETLLACATAQNFGIVGNGKIHILEVVTEGPKVGVRELCSYDTNDGLYHTVWSEENENHLITGSGDGTIKLWDIKAGPNNPLRSFEEHTSEAYSLDWNLQVRFFFFFPIHAFDF